ncbi:hypothetical protein F8M41_005730 [Gigaspora margarita]|uniref:Uncharacterized protein n=1 Tax=Gigaspora margarita TaxID=4874 RepID=A0A8H3X7P0_GIGMA|nr:hypothetical protein F8M41_005730 [Gigaspora margarita]
MHQVKYQQMYNQAIEKYRKMQGVLMITNKANKDQVHAMLKTKLMTDYFKQTDVTKKDPYEIIQDLFYRIGFIAIKTQLKFEQVHMIVHELKEEKLLPLPENPDMIAEDI